MSIVAVHGPSSMAGVGIPAAKGAAAPGAAFGSEATVTAQDAPNAAKLGPLGYVAAPTSNWTSGQSISFLNPAGPGTFLFNWTGAAWAAGAHA